MFYAQFSYLYSPVFVFVRPFLEFIQLDVNVNEPSLLMDSLRMILI